jgi:hypothetical protein
LLAETYEVNTMAQTPKQKAIELLKPPFKFECGYIFDSAKNENMVADDGGDIELGTIARLRGWGRLGKLDDGEQVQDAIGEVIAEALNQYFERLGS